MRWQGSQFGRSSSSSQLLITWRVLDKKNRGKSEKKAAHLLNLVKTATLAVKMSSDEQVAGCTRCGWTSATWAAHSYEGRFSSLPYVYFNRQGLWKAPDRAQSQTKSFLRTPPSPRRTRWTRGMRNNSLSKSGGCQGHCPPLGGYCTSSTLIYGFYIIKHSNSRKRFK